MHWEKVNFAKYVKNKGHKSEQELLIEWDKKIITVMASCLGCNIRNKITKQHSCAGVVLRRLIAAEPAAQTGGA